MRLRCAYLRCWQLPARLLGIGFPLTVVAGLAVSDPPAQAQVEALRDEAEKLRDFIADLQTTINSLLGKLRTHGLIAS